MKWTATPPKKSVRTAAAISFEHPDEKKKIKHSNSSIIMCSPFILAEFHHLWRVFAWMPVKTMWRGARPLQRTKYGGKCVCVCVRWREKPRKNFHHHEPRVSWSNGTAYQESSRIVHPWPAARLCTFSFFLLCFIIRHFLDWRASCLDRIASDISAGEFFLRFFFYFVCAFFNTGSDKVALQDLIVKKHTALSSPFPFLSSFLAIER